MYKKPFLSENNKSFLQHNSKGTFLLEIELQLEIHIY